MLKPQRAPTDDAVAALMAFAGSGKGVWGSDAASVEQNLKSLRDEWTR